MSEHRVVWEIDVFANTPWGAAVAARAAMTRPGTIAKVFDVVDTETGRRWRVDLTEGTVEDA